MATDGEPLIMSASEVASAPPAVQVYLNKLRRQQRDRALSTKSVQLAKVPIVEVSPPSLPSGVDSTAVETKTRVEALIHELLLLVPDELGHVLKGHVASPAVWAADSHDNNGASKSALPLQEPKQLPPTSELRQQSGTMEKAPDGIALEPAAKQSSTERVPAACPVQQGGETKPANAQEQEPIDVDMFASDWTDTPQSLPKLAGPDTEQLEALVVWGEKHWPKKGLVTFRPKQMSTSVILHALVVVELADTRLGTSLHAKRRDRKSGAVVLHHTHQRNGNSEVIRLRKAAEGARHTRYITYLSEGRQEHSILERTYCTTVRANSWSYGGGGYI